MMWISGFTSKYRDYLWDDLGENGDELLTIFGGFQKGGYPNSWMLFVRENPKQKWMMTSGAPFMETPIYSRGTLEKKSMHIRKAIYFAKCVGLYMSVFLRVARSHKHGE